MKARSVQPSEDHAWSWRSSVREESGTETKKCSDGATSDALLGRRRGGGGGVPPPPPSAGCLQAAAASCRSLSIMSSSCLRSAIRCWISVCICASYSAAFPCERMSCRNCRRSSISFSVCSNSSSSSWARVRAGAAAPLRVRSCAATSSGVTSGGFPRHRIIVTKRSFSASSIGALDGRGMEDGTAQSASISAMISALERRPPQRSW
mmetsp:Transcript_13289/g.33428  ORF Transcript_13289/g.33428 Transcript_13289/m.33428 type:complete len:207 (+) Transcript_13289:895-1515(+)